jgi:hypothetical protein
VQFTALPQSSELCGLLSALAFYRQRGDAFALPAGEASATYDVADALAVTIRSALRV